MTPRQPLAVEPPEAPARQHPPTPAALAAELATAFEREAQAVGELRDALARQRQGVATDSVAAVNASCDDIGRILVALDAARRARLALLGPLAPAGEPHRDALERLFGGSLPDVLADAHAALRTAAEGAAREASINRAVLRRTIESGEAFLQALFSNVAEPQPTYRGGERPGEGGPGFLLDRKA